MSKNSKSYASIATVGEYNTPVIIKGFGLYADGSRYAICRLNTLDIDVPVALELINIETIKN